MRARPRTVRPHPVQASPDLVSLLIDLARSGGDLVPHQGGWRHEISLGHVPGLLVIQGRALGYLTQGTGRAGITAKGRAVATLAGGGAR